MIKTSNTPDSRHKPLLRDSYRSVLFLTIEELHSAVRNMFNSREKIRESAMKYKVSIGLIATTGITVQELQYLTWNNLASFRKNQQLILKLTIQDIKKTPNKTVKVQRTVKKIFNTLPGCEAYWTDELLQDIDFLLQNKSTIHSMKTMVWNVKKASLIRSIRDHMEGQFGSQFRTTDIKIQVDTKPSPKQLEYCFSRI